MKKNILAIAILAAVIANIILSAVVLFSVVPAANNANKLVEKVVKTINLELENPSAATYAKVPLKNRKTYEIGKGITVNLKKAEGEVKNRYALIDWSIILNSEAADYKDVSANLSEYYAVLNDHLVSLVKAYTADNLDEEEIKRQMLSYCRTYFRSSDTGVDDELVVAITLYPVIQ
ncbi:MAG: hypothetical protein K6G60_08085 [Lachnospiraceae bacterium]|nr:hypothetical protein [Lachnospiraceae bacterium]